MLHLKGWPRRHFVRKAELEQALQAVPDFEAPQAALEQYPTPAAIAADLLFAAKDEGDIQGKDVLDLGCGTGIFSLGAGLLGASSVTGIDVDAVAVATARQVTAGLTPVPTFEVMDVADWRGAAQTAISNPPFGAQRKGADRPFFAAAARSEGIEAMWFLAQPKTERFLAAQARELGGELELILTWPYPIEARFDFHDRAVRSIQVGGYRIGW